MKKPREQPPERGPSTSWAQPQDGKITRAMNLDLPEQEVIDSCRRAAVSISAIETLLSGGTHLVCVTIEGADEARHLFRHSIIIGSVRRASFQRIDRTRLG